MRRDLHARLGPIPTGTPGPTPTPTPAPVNTILPAISGTPTEGQTLTASQGTWTNSPSSYDYQWKRGATNVGTNSASYAPVTADVGATMTCVVTATNAGGSTPATSAGVGPVAAIGGALPDFLPTFSVAPAVVYGQGQIVSTYSGPSFRAVRASDSATLNVPNASRALDVSGVSAFTSGTTMAVDTWYDQSAAAGGNAVQATSAQQLPFRLENEIGGNYPITNITGYFDLPAIVTARDNVTVLAVFLIPIASEGNGTTRAVWSLGNSTTLANNFTMGYTGAAGGTLQVNSGTARNPNMGAFQASAFQSARLITGIGSGVSSHTLDAKVANSAANAVTAATLTGGRIGFTYTTSTAQSRGIQHMLFYAVYPGVLTDAEVKKFGAWAERRFGATASPALPQFIDDGDSITAQNLSDQLAGHSGRPLQLQTQELLNGKFEFQTVAVSGNKASTQYANRANGGAKYDATRVANYSYILLGTNDINENVGTADEIYDNYILPLHQYYAGVGCTKGFICKLPPGNYGGTGGGSQSSKNAVRLALNARIDAGAAANNYTVIDYASIAWQYDNPAIGSVLTGVGTDYAGGLHPNESGIAKMAAVRAAAIAAAGIDVMHLLPLDFHTDRVRSGTADDIWIMAVSPGSTLSASGLPAGVTLDSAGRKLVWDGVTAFPKAAIALTETLSGAIGSPRVTNLTLECDVLIDSFSGEADGTALTAHTPELGGAWSVQPVIATNSSPKITSAGQLYSDATRCVTMNAAVLGTGQYVEGTIKANSLIIGNRAGLVARAHATDGSCYYARYHYNNGAAGQGWELGKYVNGTPTAIGTAVNSNQVSTAAPRLARLEVTGTTNPRLQLFVGGTLTRDETDTGADADLTGGRAGTMHSGAASSTTGMVVEDIRAGSL